MDTNKTQVEIFGAMCERGYNIDPETGKKWTSKQLFWRQVFKCVEELGEIFQMAQLPYQFLRDFEIVAAQARMEFDEADVDYWEGLAECLSPENMAALRWELADVEVTVCNAAQAIKDGVGHGFDVRSFAHQKATDDIGRGVRGWAEEN